jgi:hypothetical protein
MSNAINTLLAQATTAAKSGNYATVREMINAVLVLIPNTETPAAQAQTAVSRKAYPNAVLTGTNATSINASVTSTNIRHLNYNRNTQRLRVTFTNGSVYDYLRVPLNVLEALLEAESVGSTFNRLIKNAGYLYSRVS